MPAIVEFPTIVKDILNEFAPLFASEPGRRHFAEYLTGLIIAHKKNVSAINREFAVTTDQSCLNRWLTSSGWDEEALNLQRIEWLQQRSDTRFSRHGVIPIDNVLFRQLVDWAVQNEVLGDFTFDSWFTHKDNLNHIHALGRNYVGDLKFNRKLFVAGREIKAEDFAAQIAPTDRQEVHLGRVQQWFFTKSVRIPGVDHKVRVVIL